MAATSSARRQPGGPTSRRRKTTGRPRRRGRRKGNYRVSATILLGGAVLLAGLGIWTVHEIGSRPGGFEEWVGDTVSDLRLAHPRWVDPMARLEDRALEFFYRASVWWHRQKPDTPALATDGDMDRDSADSSAGPNVPAASAVPPAHAPVAPAAPSARAPAASTAPSAAPADSTPSPAPSSAPAVASHGLPEWKPLAGGPSWLKVAWLTTNPAFRKEPSLLLSFDPKDVRLHWQPGSRSPWNMTPAHKLLADANPKPDRSGRIPAEARKDTLLAFGGGFESIHFYNYGAIHRGEMIVPLTNGIQTLASYNDGSLRMAPWGSSELPKEGIVEARQNLPPLIHHGRIPPNIVSLNSGTLNSHYTLDSDGHRVYTDVHTWRSGLGLTAGGELVYAFGPRLTPRLIAEALLRAGAVEAMMLDINAAYHCTPSLIVPEGDRRPQIRGIYPGVNCGDRFLDGSRKDFYYAEARAGERPRA